MNSSTVPTNDPTYCVIVVHAKGEFPALLQTMDGLPLLFDNWCEAVEHLKVQIGKDKLKYCTYSDGRATTLSAPTGTRFTILKLKDVD